MRQRLTASGTNGAELRSHTKKQKREASMGIWPRFGLTFRKIGEVKQLRNVTNIFLSSAEHHPPPPPIQEFPVTSEGNVYGPTFSAAKEIN
jgi:hypothetical protein